MMANDSNTMANDSSEEKRREEKRIEKNNKEVSIIISSIEDISDDVTKNVEGLEEKKEEKTMRYIDRLNADIRQRKESGMKIPETPKDLQVVVDENPITLEKKEYGNAEINRMLEIFKKYHPMYKVSQKERNACYNLLRFLKKRQEE
jgi:fructose-1,6-bisphosphatase